MGAAVVEWRLVAVSWWLQPTSSPSLPCLPVLPCPALLHTALPRGIFDAESANVGPHTWG